jgi:uncharacterized protein YicC (UPF0701 family)
LPGDFCDRRRRGKALHLNEDLMRELVGARSRVRGALPDAGGLAAADVLRWPGMLGADTVPWKSSAGRAASCCEGAGGARPPRAARRAPEGAAARARSRPWRLHIAGVAPRIPPGRRGFREKLAGRLKEALAGGDDERLRQEVALFATMIDVDEELSRLSTHVTETKRVLASGGAAGKRLDFLMQEMNREANTLGSKSADAA